MRCWGFSIMTPPPQLSISPLAAGMRVPRAHPHIHIPAGEGNKVNCVGCVPAIHSLGVRLSPSWGGTGSGLFGRPGGGQAGAHPRGGGVGGTPPPWGGGAPEGEGRCWGRPRSSRSARSPNNALSPPPPTPVPRCSRAPWGRRGRGGDKSTGTPRGPGSGTSQRRMGEGRGRGSATRTEGAQHGGGGRPGPMAPAGVAWAFLWVESSNALTRIRRHPPPLRISNLHTLGFEECLDELWWQGPLAVGFGGLTKHGWVVRW